MKLGRADGWVDTDVLLRHLTGEPPELARPANELLARAHAGEIILHLHSVTLAEAVWALHRSYGVARADIARTLGGVLQAGGIVSEEADVVLGALDDYATLTVDFPGAVLARRAAASAAPACYTFDRHFERLGVTHRRPG